MTVEVGASQTTQTVTKKAEVVLNTQDVAKAQASKARWTWPVIGAVTVALAVVSLIVALVSRRSDSSVGTGSDLSPLGGGDLNSVPTDMQNDEPLMNSSEETQKILAEFMQLAGEKENFLPDILDFFDKLNLVWKHTKGAQERLRRMNLLLDHYSENMDIIDIIEKYARPDIAAGLDANALTVPIDTLQEVREKLSDFSIINGKMVNMLLEKAHPSVTLSGIPETFKEKLVMVKERVLAVEAGNERVEKETESTTEESEGESGSNSGSEIESGSEVEIEVSEEVKHTAAEVLRFFEVLPTTWLRADPEWVTAIDTVKAALSPERLTSCSAATFLAFENVVLGLRDLNVNIMLINSNLKPQLEIIYDHFHTLIKNRGINIPINQGIKSYLSVPKSFGATQPSPQTPVTATRSSTIGGERLRPDPLPSKLPVKTTISEPSPTLPDTGLGSLARTFFQYHQKQAIKPSIFSKMTTEEFNSHLETVNTYLQKISSNVGQAADHVKNNGGSEKLIKALAHLRDNVLQGGISYHIFDKLYNHLEADRQQMPHMD
jgi:hypothetical protein